MDNNFKERVLFIYVDFSPSNLTVFEHSSDQTFLGAGEGMIDCHCYQWLRKQFQNIKPVQLFLTTVKLTHDAENQKHLSWDFKHLFPSICHPNYYLDITFLIYC